MSNSAADGRRRRKEISPQRGQGCREGHEVFNQKVKEHKGDPDLNQDKDTTMSDETASKALDDYWDHIAFTAYEHFLKVGIGMLDQNDPEAEKMVDKYFRKWSRGLLSS